MTRSLMAFMVDAYTEDEAPNAKGGVDKRTVLKLDPRLSPVKAAVLPLSRNSDLSPKARDLAARLREHWNVDFDDAQAIGKRYRRFSTMITSLPGVELGQMYSSSLSISQWLSAG